MLQVKGTSADAAASPGESKGRQHHLDVAHRVELVRLQVSPGSHISHVLSCGDALADGLLAPGRQLGSIEVARWADVQLVSANGAEWHIWENWVDLPDSVGYCRCHENHRDVQEGRHGRGDEPHRGI